ncbi:MAG: DISARM system phospholipase D-like protein DrmC [Sandaracinaceae bacterium]|nr:DISARM system phospholipase D-like protein DrmC [Sandaracinaceae bacterium]
MSTATGLARISLHDLESLERAIERGTLAAPITETALVASGFAAGAADIVEVLRGVDAAGALAAVRVALAERRHRAPPRLDLVWTGPEARLSTSRDTAIVVRQLFERARQSVLVGGFRFDHGEDLFRPLHAVMRDHGVRATFFVDIATRAATAAGAEAHATDFLDRFFWKEWRFGDPKPELYYDPRTAAPGPPWVSLHAKCVVIDDEIALITSANFTDRGQTRNTELGVRIEDEAFAGQVAAQWRGLISAGIVRRHLG